MVGGGGVEAEGEAAESEVEVEVESEVEAEAEEDPKRATTDDSLSIASGEAAEMFAMEMASFAADDQVQEELRDEEVHVEAGPTAEAGPRARRR